MRLLAMAAAVAVLTLVSACGGGGGGSGGASGGSAGASNPTLNVTLSASSGSASVIEGTAASASVTATAATVSTPVYTDISYDKTVLGSVQAAAGSTAGTYSITATSLATLAPGSYATTITFRLCEDSACGTVYSGSTVTYSFNLTVKPADWSTYQGNAAHTGFVDVTLDATKFAKAWAWSLPVSGTYATAINSVATGNGDVFVSKDDYNGNGYVYALNESTGAVAWTANLGNLVSEGPPAYANGRVYINVINNYNAGQTLVLDANTGAVLSQYGFQAAGNILYPPVVANGKLLTTSISLDPRIFAVFYIATINSYSLDGSNALVQTPATGGSRVSQSVATDGTNLYYYSTPTAEHYTNFLDVFSGSTLASQASISDTFAPSEPPYTSNVDDGYYGAPIIASAQTVLSYSGPDYSGALLSSAEPLHARNLVSFNRSANTLGWQSANSYLTTPAVAKGVAYVARNNPAVLEALDVTTGAVQWSWSLPAGDTAFHRNVVAVNNLVFVSTDKHVYAIDTTTHQQVWSYAASGQLAISSNLVLYIATGATVGDGGLVAIKLQ